MAFRRRSEMHNPDGFEGQFNDDMKLHILALARVQEYGSRLIAEGVSTADPPRQPVPVSLMNFHESS